MYNVIRVGVFDDSSGSAVLDIVGFEDKERLKLLKFHRKYEFKEACDGVYIHKTDTDIDSTVHVKHKVINDENKAFELDADFFNVNPDPLLKELYDDIKEHQAIDVGAVHKRADWLIQFLVAYAHLINSGLKP